MPSKYEIHDYGIMQDLAFAKDSDELMNAIRGRGAFRYFKDKIYDLGLVDEWY